MRERSPNSARVRPGCALRTGVVLVALLAFAGYLVQRYGHGDRARGCTVVSGRDDGAVYRLSSEQAANAATIAAVGTSRGMPERAVTIALATALQESGLRDLDHGDRDSLGLFQQRPSQGWGTPARIMDPVYASRRFYERLAKVHDYTRLPLTVAAQRVQRSGFPKAYAKHEPDARLLAAALTGRAPAALTCEGGPGKLPGDPAEVRRALVRDFGAAVLSAPPPAAAGSAGGGRAGGSDGERRRTAAQERVPDADEAAARNGDAASATVSVRVTAGRDGGGARPRGWELAHWAVAHASALHIAQVGYGNWQWTADRGDAWRTADGDGTAEVASGVRTPDGDTVRIVTARARR